MCESTFFRRECVEDYFSSLSPMARRIVVDTETAKKQCGVRWNTLTYADRCDVIMDSMVKTKVGDKYSYYPLARPDVESFPKLSVRGGEKYVIDEENQTKGTGNRWRDEHSGPFTWETRSQMNLHFSERSKEEPPLPKTGPPVERLHGAKFYKPLPTTKPAVQEKPSVFTFETFRGPATPETIPLPNPEEEQKEETKLEPPVLEEPVVIPRPRKKKMTAIQVLPPAISGDLKTDVKEMVEAPQQIVTAVQDQKPVQKPKPIQERKTVEATAAPMSDLSAPLTNLTLSADLSPSNDSDIPKTGFDFLDDW